MSDKLRVGLAMCGSFCTFEKVLGIAENLKDRYDLTAILSETAAGTDTRFGKAIDYITRLEALTGKPVIRTIPDAEPIGRGDHGSQSTSAQRTTTMYCVHHERRAVGYPTKCWGAADPQKCVFCAFPPR